MDRTQHRSNNQVLGAPPGWDQGALPCGALAITRTVVDGQPAMVSFWRPTPLELQLLQEGGTVAVWVYGLAHPPISVGVEP